MDIEPMGGVMKDVGIGVSYAYVSQMSQLDPRWSGVRLGTSYQTIGQYGCLITAVASGLKDLGVTIHGHPPDPALLNRWLARNDGYVSGNHFVFASVEKLGGVRMANYLTCYDQPAPMGKIARALANEKVVVVQVDFRPGGAVNQHWVRLVPPFRAQTVSQVRESLTHDIRIMDPWVDHHMMYRWLMATYAQPDWNTPARAIFRVVIYEKTGNDTAEPEALSASSETQSQLHLRR
jgi:hypothetical protein